ncbi:VCBS repeat-containing protein [Streptomyces sp. ISL-99]|uniref:FG-GAP-like repeat-containing protein n=1 Tax=Streptomyces sp. ISL-99 TaxID=2819193 RepID=UPI001BE8A429|nr:FG-GAP-like repeat-containing protein [Streptomyces sp. ISL-99]MBT2527967.1 VCBS repeat-containing protein [Streptomyces sp. ISL-99]
MTGRHSPGRRRTFIRTGIATAAALAVAGGATPLLLQGAQAEPTPLTIPVPDRFAPLKNTVHDAGASGFLTREEQEGDAYNTGFGPMSGYRWIPQSGDAQAVGSDPADSGVRVDGSASDVVALYTKASRTVELKDLKAGTSTTFTLPDGHIYLGATGGAVLTATSKDTGGIEALHVLRKPNGGELTDTTVTGAVPASAWPVGADGHTIALRTPITGGQQITLVDLDAGRATLAFPAAWASAQLQVALSDKYVGWYDSEYGDDKVHLLRRDTLDGAETTVDVAGSREYPANVAVLGDYVLATTGYSPQQPGDEYQLRQGGELRALPIGGGDAKTLLPHAALSMAAASDGGVLVTGGADAGHWAVRKATVDADGLIGLSTLRALPARAGQLRELALSTGVLATTEWDTNSYPSIFKRTLDLGDSPSAGDRSVLQEPAATDDASDVRRYANTLPVGTGDGRFAYKVNYAYSTSKTHLEVRSSAQDTLSLPLPTNDANGFPTTYGHKVLSASGRYVVFGQGTGSGDHQYVADMAATGGPKIISERVGGGSAVWGTRLWTVGDSDGTIKAVDLKSKETVDTVDIGCTPTRLQAVGRWVAWDCTSGSGLYDRTTKQKTGLPAAGELGDGYLLSLDKDAGKVRLTDLHTGTVGDTRDLADLPGTTGKITADRFGGGVAWLDTATGVVHAQSTGLPTSPLAKIESHPDTSVYLKSTTDARWDGSWQLSKPAASGAQVVIKDRTGRTVRTLDATTRGAALTAAWDGKVSGTTYATDGTYTWTLTAAPKDGQSAALQLTGRITLAGGARGHHDLNGGAGDLMTLDSSGYLTTHYGDGKGAFGSKASGSGWPAGTYAVPFGDLTGDRCNDLLVRMPDGSLRRYTGKCAGGGYSPSGNYAAVSTGWQQYNVLTAPGDLTGDGRTDLIARQASTGDIYLYADNGSGGFKSRVKIRSAWTTYTHITGVGDLNGDGFGDLLARRSDGTLFRYDGTGGGQFKDRVTVFTSWGKTYNAMVGVGDITGDGKGDLVVRDTSGNLYRNDGKGNGSFTSRTQITTGWQGYKGLF